MRYTQNQIEKHEWVAREVSDKKEYPGRMVLFAILKILIASYMEIRNQGDTLNLISHNLKPKEGGK